MKGTWVSVVTVAVGFLVTIISGDNDCAPDVFCGSLEDNGYCGNSAHCSSNLKWFHNAATGKCQTFRYYGDGGNYNRFSSKEQCERTCIGYSKYYKPNKICKTCPKPVHIDVPFDFNHLRQSGFFCNGDDCNCPFGTKCCPVVYNVNSGDVILRSITEDADEGLLQDKRQSPPASLISKEFNGYKCLPIVQGRCEDAIENCSKTKRSKHRQTYRTYH